jgi:hypothetical protein
MNDTVNNRAASAFVPLLLLMIGLLIWAGAQMFQLFSEHSTLKTLLANQAAPFSASQKLRVQLDAVASGTQRLADQGNQNARLVVDELRKRGITINPSAAPVALPDPVALPQPGTTPPASK